MDWPLLGSLAGDERAAVLDATRRRSFARGEVVFHEADPSTSLHMVVSGHLAVRVSTADGSTALLNVLSAGDTFGELSLLESAGAPTRSATVACLDAVETRVLPAAAFRALCEEHPAVQGWLSALLAQRVRELSERVRDLMFVPLDRRVHRALLELAEKYDDGRRPTVVPLTQEHLADYVGGTRPSVNQVLQRLVADAVVGLGRGRVLIEDPAALHRLAAG